MVRAGRNAASRTVNKAPNIRTPVSIPQEVPIQRMEEKRKPYLKYAILGLVAIVLVVSAISFFKPNQVSGAVVGTSVDSFLKKATNHDELKSYSGIVPVNIIQITNDNLAKLQAQINGLDQTYVGDYIIQYNDRIVVYNYNNDQIKASLGFQQPAQLPQDFFDKLNKHPELQGIGSEQPIGGQLDEQSLAKLKEQFPSVYKNAKVSDFLLRYPSRLVVYDYPNDRVVVSVRLS